MEGLKRDYEMEELVRFIVKMDLETVQKLFQTLVASNPEENFVPLLKSFRDMQYLSNSNPEAKYSGSLFYQAALITSVLFEYNYSIRDPKLDSALERYKNELLNYNNVERFFESVFGKENGMLLYGLYLNFGKRWNIARFVAHMDYMINNPEIINRLIDGIESGRVDEVLKRPY